MDVAKATRLVVQAIAVALGLFGLFMLYIGLAFEMGANRSGPGEFTPFRLLFIVCFCFVFGSVFATVAWWNLRHYGARSIRELSAVLAFLLFGGLSKLLSLHSDAPPPHPPQFAYTVLVLVLPLLVAFLFHRVARRWLVRLAGFEETGQGDAPTESTPPASRGTRV